MPKKQKNQKSQKHRVPPYKRPFVVAIFLILLVAVVAAVIMICVNLSRRPVEPGSATPEQGEPLGSQSQQAPSTISPDSPNAKPTQYEGDAPNSLGGLTGSIPHQYINNGRLIISAMIDQYLVNDGTCDLKIKNDNYTYTATVAAVADVTTSVCEPFNIDLADFPAGVYQIEIQISGDDKTGLITGEVEL